mmetsp:Transcript_102540/g.289577  ORF Transcript_102540/g.289577 Transcript_102540/m.289577 type:complete len:212 (+) Transcript_102540:373-1008(+)
MPVPAVERAGHGEVVRGDVAVEPRVVVSNGHVLRARETLVPLVHDDENWVRRLPLQLHEHFCNRLGRIRLVFQAKVHDIPHVHRTTQVLLHRRHSDLLFVRCNPSQALGARKALIFHLLLDCLFDERLVQAPGHAHWLTVNGPRAICAKIHRDFLEHRPIADGRRLEELLRELVLDVYPVVRPLDFSDLLRVAAGRGLQDHQPTVLPCPEG